MNESEKGPGDASRMTRDRQPDNPDETPPGADGNEFFRIPVPRAPQADVPPLKLAVLVLFAASAVAVAVSIAGAPTGVDANDAGHAGDGMDGGDSGTVNATATPTATPSSTPTPSPALTPTSTPTPTPTSTPSPTPASTPTPPPTATPTPSPTPTPTPTLTPTPAPTPTPTEGLLETPGTPGVGGGESSSYLEYPDASAGLPGVLAGPWLLLLLLGAAIYELRSV